MSHDNQIPTGGFPEKALRPKTLTYNSYLQIGQLINLQHPHSNPVAHDEMLFIVIHQVYELWFKLVLFEIDALTGLMKENNILATFRGLDRLCEIFRVLIQQIDVLETMSPVDFNQFRSHLNPASGFQSMQFRAFELACGADPSEYDKFTALEPEWKDRLEERKQKTSIRQGLVEVLQRNGLLTGSDSASVLAAISKIYADVASYQSLHNLCEDLLRLDEQVALWRFRHVQMVERMIGMKAGTGGSLGVAYLKQTVKKRFFPELWDARTQMGNTY